MFRLELLPAGPGDCLWIEYGAEKCPHIVIIDGGVNTTFDALDRRIGQAIEQRGSPEAGLHIELMVVTHLDNDHIQGILRLLRESKHTVTIGDIWFNGKQQLEKLSSDLLGYDEADALSTQIAERNLPWNQRFGGAAIAVYPNSKLPCRVLEGGLKLTLLGPSIVRLLELRQKWRDVVRQELAEEVVVREDRMGPKDHWPPKWNDILPTPDNAVPNGSSIVLLVEYAGRAILLPGDAFADDIVEHLKRLMAERNIEDRFPLTAFKLSHHGSTRNISESLISSVECGNYLISTNGSGNQKHPDHQAILSVLRYSESSLEPCLAFNYVSETTRVWRDASALVRRNNSNKGLSSYTTQYPDEASRGLVLQWDEE